jgi:site-specific DNA-methyltransferase (adenine-specific)
MSFMNKKWDYDVPSVEIWKECLRVLKPGGHLLCFASTRTQHRMCVNVEDAGFEVRDLISWIYGSGFPKSHNIGKSTKKIKGTEEHEGWGTALKPAMELITLARKPLAEKTIAANVLEHGTGGINIDGCRVGDGGDRTQGGKSGDKASSVLQDGFHTNRMDRPTGGRHPANVIHDGSDEVEEGFPQDVKGGTWNKTKGARHFNNDGDVTHHQTTGQDSSVGSASRFFYCAKANKKDRTENKTIENKHPTVKPTKLMQYLCRLVTPVDGIVLDPFAGSGSTGKAARLEGFNAILVEMEEEYIEICEKRLGIERTK